MQLAMGLYTSILCAFYYRHCERTEIGQHVVAVLYTTDTTQLVHPWELHVFKTVP